MLQRIESLGSDWLVERVGAMADSIERIGPVAFNEANRYLPQGVSPRPGFIRYDLFPYLREILEAFDPHSNVREVNLKKGVQVGYTTLLESVLFYYICHITTTPAMFITADKELATARMENSIMPMLVESGMKHRVRSADVTNTRKTGQTKDFIQWEGGGYLIYTGAQNPAKMRQFSMPLLLKDELDGWPRLAGKDGNSDSLTDARASAYWSVRKILRGSTPTEYPSLIDDAFKRGDQRVYKVLCRACSWPQELRMEWRDTQGGFKWELDGEGVLILDSVRYACNSCGHEHYETDKEVLFSTEHGAFWHPTTAARERDVRSYHLPSFYSPYGFRPWYKNVADFIESYDREGKQVKDVGKYQVFRNNVLGEPYYHAGGRISAKEVSAHRRPVYRMGQVPNKYAAEFCGSPVLFMTCTVDVHEKNLAVAVMGWTVDSKCFLIDYWRFEDDNCAEATSPAWVRLAELLESKVYEADDGKKYSIALTLVDAGFSNAVVTEFCAGYAAGVYPILGRERTAKNQSIKEFAEFKTQQGSTGYRLLVDHYKERLAPVLKRTWTEETGQQRPYHFNAPVDVTTAQLKELTVEVQRLKEDGRGNTSMEWHRPSGARNELWDLLVYGNAAVEILAWAICIGHFELETIDWPQFWEYIEREKLYFTCEGTPNA